MHDSGNLSDYFLLCECVHGFRVCETHLESRWIVMLLYKSLYPGNRMIRGPEVPLVCFSGIYVSQEAVRLTAWCGLAESDDQTRRVA